MFCVFDFFSVVFCLFINLTEIIHSVLYKKKKKCRFSQEKCLCAKLFWKCYGIACIIICLLSNISVFCVRSLFFYIFFRYKVTIMNVVVRCHFIVHAFFDVFSTQILFIRLIFFNSTNIFHQITYCFTIFSRKRIHKHFKWAIIFITEQESSIILIEIQKCHLWKSNYSKMSCRKMICHRASILNISIYFPDLTLYNIFYGKKRIFWVSRITK